MRTDEGDADELDTSATAEHSEQHDDERQVWQAETATDSSTSGFVCDDPASLCDDAAALIDEED